MAAALCTRQAAAAHPHHHLARGHARLAARVARPVSLGGGAPLLVAPAAACRHAKARPLARDRAAQPLVVQARRQQGWGGSSGSRSGRRDGSSSSSGSRSFTFKLNQADISLSEDQLWRIALPLSVVFGFAIFLGPLVVGATLSAIAVGTAFSAGALAFTTLLLPLVLLMGAGGLLSFGLFAGLGVALVVPQLLLTGASMAVVGGGLFLGWGGVNWLLKQQQQDAAAGATRLGASSSGGVDAADAVAAEQEREERRREEEQRRRVASELREFDELLRAKERRRQQQ